MRTGDTPCLFFIDVVDVITQNITTRCQIPFDGSRYIDPFVSLSCWLIPKGLVNQLHHRVIIAAKKVGTAIGCFYQPLIRIQTCWTPAATIKDSAIVVSDQDERGWFGAPIQSLLFDQTIGLTVERESIDVFTPIPRDGIHPAQVPA